MTTAPTDTPVGRPRIAEDRKRVPKSFTLDPRVAAALDTVHEKTGEKVSHIVDRALRHGLRKAYDDLQAETAATHITKGAPAK